MSAFSIQLLIILHIIFSQNPIATTEQHTISACTCNLFKMPVKNQRQYRLNKKRKRASNIRKVARTRARRIAERQNTDNNSSPPATNEFERETSLNGEGNGGVPATIEESTTFSLCQSIDKITPAKKALQILMRTKQIEKHGDEEIISHRMPVCIICDSFIKGCNPVENVRKETIIKKRWFRGIITLSYFNKEKSW